MEKFMSKKGIVIGLLVLVVAIMIPMDATATTWADMIGKVGDQTKAVGLFIKILSGIIGVGLLLGSLVMFANMKKPGNQTGPMTPLLMLVIGVLLVSFGAFVDMGSESMFGSGGGTTSSTAILE